VGVVLGTEKSMPLEWWVGIAEDAYLQLDDVVQVKTEVPGVGEVTLSGVVDNVRAAHEGSRFESDVFLAGKGVLPLQTARSAHVMTTRVEPEVWVPPLPGDAVARVDGVERDQALHFDRMKERLVAGASRDGQPVYVNFEFLNGERGAHVNISGVSGVATKTSYACFLLYSLFHSSLLGNDAANTKAIIFNVKGEDLLFLDKPNARLEPEEAARYEQLGLPAGPFSSVGLWAPVRKGVPTAVADTGTRKEGVTPYYWTLREFVQEGLLRYMFAETGDERSQVADLVARVDTLLRRHAEEAPGHPAQVQIDGKLIESFEHLLKVIEGKLTGDSEKAGEWVGHAAPGTVTAFLRRFESALHHCGHLVKGREADHPEKHRIDWQRHQVTVIDLQKLNDRAKRFVVGAVIKRLFERKEESGSAKPLVFLVLDELNKYAPREGWSPIKEVLLDIAERGRSLGVILVGAQQTASEVERRVVANSAIRVVGRLDPAEAKREEYGFLPSTAQGRAVLLKPGSMLVQQPELPVPLEIGFPFPSWATRLTEVGASPAPSASAAPDETSAGTDEEDPFARFD